MCAAGYSAPYSAWVAVQQALEHRDALLKLVEHWKGEAERQAQFAQVLRHLPSLLDSCMPFSLPHPVCNLLQSARLPAGVLLEVDDK